MESEYVSRNLHHWIDLIFGFKQTGPEAEKALNIFHPFTYEGEVDVDAIQDAAQRDSVMAQIHNFGQTPSQLFTRPHPTAPSAKQSPSDAARPGTRPHAPNARRI